MLESSVALKGNRLIAYFMMKSKCFPVGVRRVEDLRYHWDWNELMPVVERIEAMDYGIKQCRKVVEIYIDSTKEVIIKTKEVNRIESLYKAVVEFVKRFPTIDSINAIEQ